MTQGGWGPQGGYDPNYPYGPPPPQPIIVPAPMVMSPVYYPVARIRPRASASVVLPLVGALLIVCCLLVLPWVSTSTYLPLPKITDRLGSPDTFAEVYAVAGAYVMGFFGIIYALAANLDSSGWRWTHFAFAAIGGTCFGGGGLLYGLGAVGARSSDGGLITFSLVGMVVAFGVFFGLAMLRGLACRIVGGALMLVYAGVHAAAVHELLGTHASPFAYFASLGYVLCAIGALVGPRYVPSL